MPKIALQISLAAFVNFTNYKYPKFYKQKIPF